MTEPLVVEVSGLRELDSIADLPDKIATAAYRAINTTTERARTAAGRRMREQVNFPASYLSGSDGRLGISKRASKTDLEAVITGRHRPTSLARFLVGGGSARRKGGVRVMVKPGHATFLPKAFLVKLRSGNTDTTGNVGLAIRLPAGKRPDRAYKPVPIGRGAWLLFGPSVDQIFDDVATEISPETADFLEGEFSRLMAL